MAPPRLPYVSSLTGDWITPEQATSPAYYAAQLRRPVQFAAGLRTLAADPDLFLLEVGPGSVLAGLARSILGTGRTPHVAASLRHPREPGSEPAALLGAAARLWLAGVALDWRGVQAGTAPRRVPLPTYPFERSWHGVTAPPVAVAAAPAGKAATADGIVRLYAPSWLRDGSLADAAPELRGCWIVFGDAGRVTDALMARLEACGATPLRVEAGPAYAQHTDRQFTVSAGAAADIAAVLQACTARHGPVAGAIVLWGMEGGRVATPLQVYAALVALATGLGSWERPEPVPVLVATTGTQSVLDEPVRHPGAALVLGPVLVLPTEVPGLRMRAVDLDPAGDAAPIADTLVLEAATPCHEPVVAHRSGRRWLQRFAPIRLSRAEGGLRQGGRYLITGGLGGIGLELARWLAGQVSARLLLTSRRALPPRAEWDGLLAAAGDHAWSVPAIRAIRAIESAGGEVIAVAADAADLPAMRAALHEAKQRWGGIDGVVHGAGVPGSGAIALRQDAGDAQAVIAPKVDGLGVLVELMADTPLDFVALMGSINAVLGAAGACDYAAANTVLDAFAESRTPPAWRRVVTIAWGAWAEVGMAASRVVPPARQAEHAALLRTGIPTQDGLEAFARILASGHSRVVATTFDLPLLQDELRDAGGLLPLAAPEPDPVVSRPELSSVYLAPDTALHRELAAIWTELTGVARIGMHDDFFALGGHSLLATRLLARVSARLGVSLALRDVFEAPTIHLLAQRIETASSLPDPGQGTEDEREEILI